MHWSDDIYDVHMTCCPMKLHTNRSTVRYDTVVSSNIPWNIYVSYYEYDISMEKTLFISFFFDIAMTKYNIN